MPERSPRRLRNQVEALQQFRDAYEAYLRRADGIGREEAMRLRRAVTSTLPSAEEALVFRPSIYAPPASGGYIMRGLSNIVFAHETMSFLTPPWAQLLDAVDSSIASLEEQRRREIRRRRNPLYWGDRILSVILGFPAYLIGLLLRIPPERIEGSQWGTPLRVLALAVEVALVIIGARQVGWL